MSASPLPGSSVDLRWTGIAEVFIGGLGGSVLWEPGSVVLRLPARAREDRVADLDSLRLCLGRIGVPVVFDPAREGSPDPTLVDFLRKLTESGLMVGSEPLAA